MVASLCLDLVDDAWVDLDLVHLTGKADQHLEATISLTDWSEDGILLEAWNAVVAVGDKPEAVAGVVAGQIKGVEVGHGVFRVAKVWAIIGVVDTHLHAVPLDSDCIDTCFLQTPDEDVAGDDLIASDQGFRVAGANGDDVG